MTHPRSRGDDVDFIDTWSEAFSLMGIMLIFLVMAVPCFIEAHFGFVPRRRRRPC